MIERILVCLEGSPATDEATRAALEIARDLAATLLGLAIVDEPDIRAGRATSIGGASYKHERDEALIADARARAGAFMARFADRCAAAGVTARTVERVGRPATEILREMPSHDLTVMGRGANFRFETEDDDSETRDVVLHHADGPVLLVPDKAAPAGPDVLIAFDGSAASKRAVARFAQSGLAARRPVHIACVDDNGASAWEMANKGGELLRAAGVDPTALHNVVSPRSNAEALLELGAQLGAGLLVMGAYTRLRITELLRGSVTRALIEGTPVPLYLCH